MNTTLIEAIARAVAREMQKAEAKPAARAAPRSLAPAQRGERKKAHAPRVTLDELVADAVGDRDQVLFDDVLRKVFHRDPDDIERGERTQVGMRLRYMGMVKKRVRRADGGHNHVWTRYRKEPPAHGGTASKSVPCPHCGRG